MPSKGHAKLTLRHMKGHAKSAYTLTDAVSSALRLTVIGMVVAVFAAFLLLVGAEVATLSSPGVAAAHPMLDDTTRLCTSIMLFAAPFTAVLMLATSSHVWAAKNLSLGHFKTVAAYQVAGWLCYGAVLFAHTSSCTNVGGLNLPILCTPVSKATMGFMAELFIVSSLLALETLRHSPILSPRTAANKAHLFTHNYMNLLAVVGALVLALTAERVEFADNFSTNAAVGSVCLCIAAVTSTYGLGGLLVSDSWKFWQPFSGGVVFVMVQFVSWSCFTMGIILQAVFFLSIVVVEVELFVGVMGVAGVLCVASQVGMIVSLFVYQPTTTTTTTTMHRWHFLALYHMEGLFPTLMVNLPPLAFTPYALPWMFVPSFTWTDVGIYFVLHVSVQTIISISLSHLLQVYYKKTSSGATSPPLYVALPLVFSTLPLVSVVVHAYVDHPAAAATVGFAIPWYVYTYKTMNGMPAQTGSRQDKSLQKAYSAVIEATARYFSLHLVRTEPLSPSHTYIFGFHPHGIIPMTVMWLQFTDQWRALFPNVFACPLSASVVHYFPGIRDVIQVLGAREVTRSSARFRGFGVSKGLVRMALEHDVSLVPVLSFKEGEILDNIIRWPVAHRTRSCRWWSRTTFRDWSGLDPPPTRNVNKICI
ncbi:hypothetical protein DYB25_003403 [Aphanomyces astaci]|uniref:Acyltransferase n=1 Tax=Aphanomyces astaci TaxID=112090 RepID=A0A397B359_APHAT|nr:hypothetical protein DYB25_003403 [Aphanomyces astaci]